MGRNGQVLDVPLLRPEAAATKVVIKKKTSSIYLSSQILDF